MTVINRRSPDLKAQEGSRKIEAEQISRHTLNRLLYGNSLPLLHTCTQQHLHFSRLKVVTFTVSIELPIE